MEKIMNFLKHPAFISILVLVIAIGGVYLLLTAWPEEKIDSAAKVERVSGKADSKVVVQSYSDLECPACKVYWLNSEKELMNKYQDKVRFEFHHFPLSIHANAKLASQAAEAAGAQGKFFEFVDYTYQKQSTTEASTWGIDKFTEYARAVGVTDIDRFKRELQNKYYLKAINEWVDDGEKRGVDSTPTIYVNGKKMGNYDVETLSKEIDAALQKEYPSSIPTSTPSAQ